mmetsp:Transcript_6420/g.16232  ORF Transcript_6420/g.16232 Transcript_6420/m.16232 type:complete len:291 (+) Transcript_6420:88-960(+)
MCVCVCVCVLRSSLLFIFVTDPRSQIEGETTEVGQTVLDDERETRVQRQSDALGKWRGLGHHVEVAQGEGLFDRRIERDGHRLLLGGVSVAGLHHLDVAAAHVSLDTELDAVLGDGDLDGVTQCAVVLAVTEQGEITAGALELSGRHLDHGLGITLRDSEQLALDVHQLELKVGDLGLLLALEHERDGVTLVVRLDGELVFVASTLENLAHRVEVDAQGHIAIAAVVLEALGTQKHGHQRDVTAVHRLQADALLGALKVGLLDQILHCFDQLLQNARLSKTCLEHGCFVC